MLGKVNYQQDLAFPSKKTKFVIKWTYLFYTLDIFGMGGNRHFKLCIQIDRSKYIG